MGGGCDRYGQCKKNKRTGGGCDRYVYFKKNTDIWVEVVIVM